MQSRQKQKRDRQNAIKSPGRNPPSDRSQKRRSSDGGNTNVKARQDRANTLVSRDSSAPQVSKPPALRRLYSRLVKKAKAKKEPTPKIDLFKGRMIYPVTKGGVTEYLPTRSDASDFEIAAGAFVEDDSVRKAPVNTIKDASNYDPPTSTDVKTGRTLFATTRTNAKWKEVEYLPRQSEATPLELSAGKYIPEKTPSVGKELDQPPKTDPDNNNRKLFATEAPDGSIQYYPKKNQATAKELAEGKYLEGFAAKDPVNKLKDPSELKPYQSPTSKEVATGRTLFATAIVKKDGKEGKLEYLPRQSDATIQELNAGKYIPEKKSIAGEELDQQPKTDPDNGDRQLFATQGADGSMEYFPRKNQATAQELAEGRYLEGYAAKPPVNRTLDLSNLAPRKHLTVTEVRTGRKLYATGVFDKNGKKKKTEYLPRKSEATQQELDTGKYIPEESSKAGEELFQPPITDPDNSDRKLFATKAADGSIQYFPKKNQATAQELAEGRYLEGFAAKDPVNTIEEASKYKRPTTTELRTGRTVFATTTTNWRGKSKTEYLPRQSEATEQELLTGKYIPEPDSIVREVLNKRPRYDFEHQRDLFAVKADDGSNHYWPKKSKASAKELSEGRYVEDEAISRNAPLGPANAMRNAAPKYDAKNKRKIFAVITKEGEISYLPRESEATKEEKGKGLLIPDDVVDDHESKRRRTALQDNTADMALRRAERAAKLPGGVTFLKSNVSPQVGESG